MDLMTENLRRVKPRIKEKFSHFSLNADRSKNNAIYPAQNYFSEYKPTIPPPCIKAINCLYIVF
jgi:hypothetical protein